MIENRYNIIGFAKSLDLELEDIADLFAQYLIDINTYRSNAYDAFSKKDYVELEKVIHSIKGISGNLWIDDVFHEAETFDNLLKENITKDANSHLNKIILLIETGEPDIRKVFSDANIPLE